MPAGTDIRVLIPGINLPQNTKETPYWSNHNLLLLKSFEEIPKNLPLLSTKFASFFSFKNFPKYYQGNAPRTVPIKPNRTTI